MREVDVELIHALRDGLAALRTAVANVRTNPKSAAIVAGEAKLLSKELSRLELPEPEPDPEDESDTEQAERVQRAAAYARDYALHGPCGECGGARREPPPGWEPLDLAAVLDELRDEPGQD